MEESVSSIIWVIVIAFIVFDIFVIVFLIKRKRRITPSIQSFVRTKWNTLYHYRDKKQAILEADKLLDYVLDKLGLKGTLGEKLKDGKTMFRDINSVWEAHKVRNKIAHEIGFNVDESLGRSTLNKFRKALQELGINL